MCNVDITKFFKVSRSRFDDWLYTKNYIIDYNQNTREIHFISNNSVIGIIKWHSPYEGASIKCNEYYRKRGA